MNVQKFVDEYKIYGKDYVAKHITNKYVTYAKKMSEARRIVDISMYKEIDGKKIFWHNTPIQYYLFILSLVKNYTDIEIDSTDSTVIEDFDLLNQSGLIKEIISAIPPFEYAEFETVLKMTADDEVNNVRSLPGYLDTKIETFMTLINGIVSNEEFQQSVKDNLLKMVESEEE